MSRRHRGTAILALLATLIAPGVAQARREKTVFRGQPTDLPPELAEEAPAPTLSLAPAWTFNGFHAPLAGNPARAGGGLAAASRGGDVALLDPQSGTAIWRATLPAPVEVGPAADAGRVYQAARDGRLYALDERDGRILWSADLGAPAAVPPRILDGRLLVGTTGAHLLALDPADGRIAARRALPGRPISAPEPAPGMVLVGTEHGMIVALDRRDLSVRWRHYARHRITAPPLYHDGGVYVATADRAVRRLKVGSGRRGWTARMGAIATARLFVRGRYLYVQCYDNDIYVFRANSGHLVTRVRLDHRLDADPAEDEGHLYVVPYTAATVIGLALPGLQTAGRYALDLPGEWFTTAPVLIGGRVAVGYGRTEGKILALAVAPIEKASGAPPPAPARGPETAATPAREEVSAPPPEDR
jgi:outer membrane protein assembly factor BamB